MKTLTPQILGMYLGCDCIVEPFEANEEERGTIASVNIQGYVWLDGDDEGNDDPIEIALVKPILRRLEDMTLQEKSDLKRLMRWTGDNLLPAIPSGRNMELFINKQIPEVIVWFLSKHFDLFGLIDAGLAIDAKTLQQEP